MDRPQKSGIPVPRKPNRGPAMSVSPSNRYVKSPPPLARKPKIERRDAGLIKITYSENGQPPETPQASVHTGTSELKTADVSTHETLCITSLCIYLQRKESFQV